MKDFERYIYLALFVGLLVLSFYLSCSRQKELKEVNSKVVRLTKTLEDCLNANTKLDTIIVEIERKVPVYIRVIDSIVLKDTVYLEYVRYYSDSLKTDELDLWYDQTVAGYLIGTDIRYKVRSKEIIKNNIIYKDKLVPTPETWHLYATLGAGTKPSVFFGLMGTYKDYGASLNYNFKEVMLGLHYKLK